MKENKLIRIFIFFLSLVTIISCKKEKLTKETQVGANTLSCKISGKVYTAKTDLFSPKFTGGFYTSNIGSSGELSLFASIGSYTNSSTQQFNLRIKFPQINRLGVYDLNKENFFEISPLPYTIDGKLYTTITLNNGALNITYIDYPKRIVSGTFSFITVNQKDPTEQISITDGRFDIQTN